MAPKQILLNTIIPRAAVTAIASANPVLKTMALMNPATLKITDKDAAILISLFKNWFLVFSFSVPSAKPRITVVVVE